MATYYISTTGSDGATGTSVGTAWRNIQASINKMNNGDVLEFQNGTWYEQIQINKGVTLRAANSRQAKIDGSTTPGVNWDKLVNVSANNVTIDGMDIGNYKFNYSINTRGIYVAGTDGFTITDCYVHHTNGDNLNIAYATNTLVENCEFAEGALENNPAWASGNWPNAGVAMKGGSGHVMRTSTVHGGYGEAWNADKGANNVLIEDCYFYDYQRPPYINESTNITFRRNIISHSSDVGFVMRNEGHHNYPRIANVLFENNIIVGSFGPALRIDLLGRDASTSSTMSNITVRNNTIINTGSGNAIQLEGSSFTNCVSENNVLASNGSIVSGGPGFTWRNNLFNKAVSGTVMGSGSAVNSNLGLRNVNGSIGSNGNGIDPNNYVPLTGSAASPLANGNAPANDYFGGAYANNEAGALKLNTTGSIGGDGSSGGGGTDPSGTITAAYAYSTNGLTVNFIDQSAATNGITAYQWKQNGSNFASTANPSYTFPAAGTYTVNLTVTGPDGTSTTTKSITVTVGGVTSCAGTILTNGDFASNDLTGWTGYTAGAGTFNAGTGVMVATITNQGGNTQLFQSGLSLTAGETYALEFDGSGSNSDVDIGIIKHGAPYTNLGMSAAEVLGATSNTYTYQFTATASEADARLQFFMHDNGTYAIDNVCLSPTGTTPVVITPDFTSVATVGSVAFTNTSTTSSPITAYAWTFGDTGTATTENPTHVYTANGTYDVILTVTTADGTASTTKSVTVTGLTTGVCAGNLLGNGNFSSGDFTDWDYVSNGVANFSVGTNEAIIDVDNASDNTQLYQQGFSVTAGQAYTLSFKGKASSAGATAGVNIRLENSPYTNLGLEETQTFTTSHQPYSYTFNALQNSTDLRFQVVFESNVIYTLTDFCLIEETAGAITASASATPLTGAAPIQVTFDGSGSSATNGITSYAWDFGNGDSDTGATPTYTYAATGTYTVTLTVTGPDGTDVDTLQVTVTGSSGSLPPTTGKLVMDTNGTVTLLSSHPSWADVFPTLGANLAGTIHVSLNVFSGYGQGFEPCTGAVCQFNIDTGNYRIVECDNTTVLATGTDARLAKYGTAFTFEPTSSITVRGQAYWNWYQADQQAKYGSAVYVWPTLLANQLAFAATL